MIWAATWQNQQCSCGPSQDSDQPGHPPSLISIFAVRMKKARVLSYPLSAQWRLWSDWVDAQAELSLHWAHTHFVGFVMSRLILICALNGSFTRAGALWLMFWFCKYYLTDWYWLDFYFYMHIYCCVLLTRLLFLYAYILLCSIDWTFISVCIYTAVFYWLDFYFYMHIYCCVLLTRLLFLYAYILLCSIDSTFISICIYTAVFYWLDFYFYMHIYCCVLLTGLLFQNQQNACLHLPSLIRVFAVRSWVAKDPSFLHADSEDWSD